MEVSRRDISLYLMMGGREPDPALAKRIDELTVEVRKVLRPMRVWRRISIGSLPSPGTLLMKRLEGCSSVCLVCATLGVGVDALQRRLGVSSAADALIVQAVGAAFIESWMDEIEDEIRRSLKAGETLVERYSPGYGDWPLDVQGKLLAMLDAPRIIGVSLTDTNLMVPSKSVSAAIGVKNNLKGD